MTTYTVLEIGSGSFKLHKEECFSRKFQSALGKGLQDNSEKPYSVLNSDSVKLALNNVRTQIVPFLQEQKIELSNVLVFATAAIRRSINDPGGSGKNFIAELEALGFANIRVFSEDEECIYAAKGVLEELYAKFQDDESRVKFENIAILDVGGASHQLMEVKGAEVVRHLSVPVGSHAELAGKDSPPQLLDFVDQGFKKQDSLIIIGTSGSIINAIPGINPSELAKITNDLLPLNIEERREYFKAITPNKEIHKLYVDYRLAILPNAFAIILNCADKLEVKDFIACTRQAMHYVSKHGFNS